MGNCYGHKILPLYRQLNKEEVLECISKQAECWFCKERIFHPYVLITECSMCHSIGHTQCVSIWFSEHFDCPVCAPISS